MSFGFAVIFGISDMINCSYPYNMLSGVFYIGTYSYKGLDHPSVAHNLILIYPKRVTP